MTPRSIPCLMCHDLGNDLEVEVRRVVGEAHAEPGVGRRHVRCDAWHAHVDEMQVIP